MYLSRRTSGQALLPAGRSAGSHQLTTANVNLEGIVVDTPRNDSQESTLSVAVPKPRPLNLADNYELVGGVPAFVWKPSREYKPVYQVYAISSDDTRIAIQEGSQKICVYDILDNYSFVAAWEDTTYEHVNRLTFHNNHNDELVVVFYDSTVAVMSLSDESRDGTEQQNRTFEIQDEFRVLKKYKDISKLRRNVFTHGTETWVCAWDVSAKGTVNVCSINPSGFRTLQIKSDDDMTPTFVYGSIPQKAIMLAKTRNTKPLNTVICTDLDFDSKISTDSPIELSNSQGFGFSDCGSYLLTWNYSQHSENAVEAYDVRLLKTTPNPLARIFIGRDVLRAKGMFIERNQYSLETLDYVTSKESLIAAILVASSSKVELTLWDILPNEVFKRFNLTMQGMTFSDPYHIEFCISPNTKWVAIRCWTDGVFGLFSLLNGALIWSIKLDTSNRLSRVFTPLKFDSSSSRLIINACNTLYVFAPPCLTEEYELEFVSTSMDLGQDFEESKRPLNDRHLALIPNHTLKQALLLQHALVIQDLSGMLDVAHSRIASNIALLVQRNGSLMVVQGSFETMLSLSFIKYIKSGWLHNSLPNGVVELQVDTSPLQQSQHFPTQQHVWIFLYPYEDKNVDSTIVFLTQDGLLGIFIDVVGIKSQVQIPFGNQECFALTQSKDGSRVACLHTYGVKTIDLNKRSIIHQVSYRANLAQWLVPYIAARNHSCLDVSDDATTILIGLDMKNEKLISFTSQTDNEECRILFEKTGNIIPCLCLSEDLTSFAFLEFDEDNRMITSICTYNSKSNYLKRVTREQCNLHTKRILDSLTQDGLVEHAIQIDESNGHLWIIALQRTNDQYKLVFTPLSPYSVDGCIPSLYMRDYPARSIIELKELALEYGQAFFTMHWNGKTNFQLALENKDKAMLIKMTDCAMQYEISFQELFLHSFGQRPFDVMRNAIEEQNEATIAFLLDLIGTKTFPFEEEATMMKEGFEGLWLEYRALFEPRILNKTLEWRTCEFDIPIDVFSKDGNVGARVGTSDSITEWLEAFDQGHASTLWRLLHNKDLKEMERRCSNATTTIIVVFFTIANICKIGLNGIIRFLLMQDAPSYIFKAPLLKWVIAFKWEKLWKKKSLRSFIFYLCFVALYSIYSIWTAFSGKDLNKDIATSVRLTILLLVLMAIASVFLYQEYLQMRRYIKDGRKLFPNDRSWGVWKYVSSIWNLVEVLTYLILILVIPALHFANLGGVHVLPILYTFVALETFLVCIKVWYYAQAFEGTGAFVLTMENIVKDCAPFLALAFAILVAFSFSLFVLFQHSVQEKRVLIADGEEDEVKSDLDRCFGDPAKAMVTMFYAMIGTFEPKVYYHSGSLSPIITLAFVVYLAIQMIVMVNMLIAIMGDTFDRVKSTEEEQLLMGRARFIDACEAQFSEKQIEEIENSNGKYLYVLFPKDGYITEDMRLWQGRVKTIEERVGKMIIESQNSIVKRLEKDKEEMKGSLNEIVKIKEDTKELKQMNEDMYGMKQKINNIEEDISNMMEDMTDMKDLLQLIKDKDLE